MRVFCLPNRFNRVRCRKVSVELGRLTRGFGVESGLRVFARSEWAFGCPLSLSPGAHYACSQVNNCSAWLQVVQVFKQETTGLSVCLSVCLFVCGLAGWLSVSLSVSLALFAYP